MRTDLFRKTVLTAAGAVFAGGMIAGPVAASAAVDSNSQPMAMAAERGHDKRDKGQRELNVRYEAQPNFFYCGPAAARNALTTLDKNISQDDLAREMGTTENGTDSAHQITKALNTKAGKNDWRTIEIATPQADDKQTDTLRHDIRTAVDNGRAVVANIAGTATDTNGTTHSFEGGHYI
ncbi:C39 family peptidase, partial [Micromonospora echinospora]|uniref:C39 family peptidase n=1 Tax=Micromonospora echinospora TaxID=1877 RepID=UPI0033DC8551